MIKNEIAEELDLLAFEHYEMLGDIHIPLSKAADEIRRLELRLLQYELSTGGEPYVTEGEAIKWLLENEQRKDG